MATVGIIIKDGIVQRVVSDDSALRQLDVVIMHDEKPDRLFRPRFDDAITAFVQTARGNSATHGLGLICDLASERFEQLGKEPHPSPEAFNTRIGEFIKELEGMRTRAMTGAIDDSTAPPTEGVVAIKPLRIGATVRL